MSDNAQTLRPGLLVSLHTSIKGNINYRSTELEGTHIDELTGEERKRWETTRVIVDPAEWEAAAKMRGTVRALIVAQCTQTAFGLLCPEDRADELKAAIAEARKLGDEFNETAALTRLSVNVIYGRIAQDDVQAVQAISNELRDLMEDMQAGLRTLDVQAVRQAATKAKAMGEMLSTDARGRLEVAIDAARGAARKIVKAGEVLGLEIDQAAIAKIDLARTSFLDLDGEDGDVVAAPEMEGRGLDLGPGLGTSTVLPEDWTPELDMDDDNDDNGTEA